MNEIKKKLFSKFLYNLFTINVYYSHNNKLQKFTELNTFISYSKTASKLVKYVSGFLSVIIVTLILNPFIVFSNLDWMSWAIYFLGMFIIFSSTKSSASNLFEIGETKAKKNCKDRKYARILFNKFKKPFNNSSITEIESYGLSKDFILYSQDDFNDILKLYINLPIHMLNVIDNTIGSRYNQILTKLLPYQYDTEEDKVICRDTSINLSYSMLLNKYKIPMESIQLILEGIYKQFKIKNATTYEEKRDIIQHILSQEQIQSTIISVLESMEKDIEVCDNIQSTNNKIEKLNEEQEINKQMNTVQTEIQEQVKILEKMFVR